MAARKKRLQRPPPMAAGELLDLLQRAGAPVLLAAPDLCDEAANRINNVITVLAQWRRRPLERDAFLRAQNAVDELRRVLPELYAWASLPVFEIQDRPGLGNIYQNQLEDYRARIGRLNDALFDIGPRHANKPEDHWPDRANWLFSWYRLIANPKAGISRAGPAVRFVQLALERMGEGKHSADAIEKALRRRRTTRTTTNSS